METENVLVIGGDGVTADYPPVREPLDRLDEAGYTTDVVELYPSFEERETGLDDIYDTISTALQEKPRHVVGYSAGAMLAVHYRNHPNVVSVTANDPPTGLNDGNIHKINSVIDDDAVTIVYPEESDDAYRLDGDYVHIEMADADHYFQGREASLAETVRCAVDAHAGGVPSLADALRDVDGVDVY